MSNVHFIFKKTEPEIYLELPYLFHEFCVNLYVKKVEFPKVMV